MPENRKKDKYQHKIPVLPMCLWNAEQASMAPQIQQLAKTVGEVLLECLALAHSAAQGIDV